jgi:hypothetical protein
MKYVRLIILIFCFQSGLSQSAKKKKVYRIMITYLDGTKTKGIFHNMSDSTFTISNSRNGDTTFQQIPVIKIKRFFTKQKGIVGKGAGIGIVVGSLIGLATYQPVDCGPDDIFCLDFGPGPPMGGGAVIGGLVGMGIGASIMKKWEINGDVERFNKIRSRLGKYCLKCR